MIRTVFKTVAVLALAAPMVAAAQTQYEDTRVYVPNPQEFPYVVYPSSYQLDDNYPWKTQLYSFDPSRFYFPDEQEAIIEDEVAITGGSLTSDPSTGNPLININQGSIPEASQTSVRPPVEYLPLPDSAQTSGTNYSKAYSRTESFGNSLFGGGYALNASITSTDATINQPKRVEAFAEGKVYATAFNREQEIVRARAEISGQEGGANTGSAALFAMGQQIWSTPLNYTFSPAPINWSRTFFSISKRFMVGPVPLNVTAAISGGVRVTVTGTIAPTQATLKAQPGGWANANASVSVDIIVAAAGVRGNLTLVNATLPAEGELFWPFCTINWKLKTDLNVNTVSGNVDLFVRVGFSFFGKTWDLNIARWSGLTWNRNLVSVNGTKDLGICL